MNMVRKSGALWGALGALLLCGGAGAQTFEVGEPRIGGNVENIKDWSRSQAVADMVKQARTWGSPTDPWMGGELIPLDANGWPMADAGLVLLTNQPPNVGHGGVYRITFECDVLPEVRPIVTEATAQNIWRDPVTGVCHAEFNMPEWGTHMMIGFFGTGTGVRNLKIMVPGSQDGDLWSPRYVDHLRRFKVLRFMDAHLTNDNPTTSWNQRTKMTDIIWRQKTGVPYEAAIDLCNMVGADYWVCVPFRADDDFVTNLATLVRDRLDPGLNVYVEFSNEVWNTLFRAGRENRARAVDEVYLHGDPHHLNYDLVNDQQEWGFRRYARRSMEIGQIFSQVFGAGSMNTRVRPVLSGQVANPAQYKDMLAYISQFYGEPRNYFYSLGIAPYFEAWYLDAQGEYDVDALIAGLQGSVQNWYNSMQYERMTAYVVWNRMKPMVAYESGVDTRGSANSAVKRQANYDPRMYNLCRDYIDNWHKRAGGEICWFTSAAGPWNSDWGCYPLTEAIIDQTTTKLRAIDDARVAPRPATDAGVLVPGTIEGRKHAERIAGWDLSPDPDTLPAGKGFMYLVRSECERAYNVDLIAAAWDDTATVTVDVNGTVQGTIALDRETTTYLGRDYGRFAGTTVSLPAGLSVIRVVANTGEAFFLHELVVGACDGIDFNRDGLSPDNQDLIDMLTVFGGGDCSTGGCNDLDFNNDGLFPDNTDLEDFLTVFGGGACAAACP
ncbi:MAG TPA: hypothetical protein VD971_11325 [Phycisphaerales bacterium]|nr:hypothetical protein [Phycisphaerales bacterium]